MKSTLVVLGILFLAATLSGCATPEPAVYLSSPASDKAPVEEMTGSLFPSDAQVISNEAIDKILGSQITFPAKVRVALLPFESGHSPWRYWSEDLNRLDREAAHRATLRLLASPRVAQASPLPALLVPERRTVPFLREAAARYQADLLLVYRTSSYSFQKQKFLAPEEIKAFCRVDVVLLDVRTGIVPFTAVEMEQYTTRKAKEDFNVAEAEQRARLQALGAAMESVAAKLSAFLEEAPRREFPATAPAAP